MKQHFYMTVFPMEALIASQLEPEEFAAYMAVGARKGAAEALMFIEVKETVGPFDWDEAREKCVLTPEGGPKQSFYISIYRVLEKMPPTALGSLYLVCRDGRCLELKQADWTDAKTAITKNWKGVGLYKELCPVTPLVASCLDPAAFADFMTAPTTRTRLPALLFADLRVLDNLDDLSSSGHIGNVYDQRPQHLKNCIQEIREKSYKMTKIVDRTYGQRFAYGLINTGLFLKNGETSIFWPMPDIDNIKETAYDWGRSANLF
ncbi:MAG: hypothetical protein GX804_01740 [Lentisphaerae bacterium]|jgi:hypothetical protein|nr:hypothetical protein [Lentisphaerota bacterium]